MIKDTLHFFEKNASHSFASKYTKDGHGGLLDFSCRWCDPLYRCSGTVFRRAAGSQATPGRQESRQVGVDDRLDSGGAVGSVFRSGPSHAVAGRRALVGFLSVLPEIARVVRCDTHLARVPAFLSLERFWLLLRIAEQDERMALKLNPLAHGRRFEWIPESPSIQETSPCATLMGGRRYEVHRLMIGVEQ